MKKIFTTFLFIFLLHSLFAQLPLKINYQAVARDNTGNVLSGKTIGVRFSIHDGSPTGLVQYAETFVATTNQFGLFTLGIGTGLPFVGTFTDITWSVGSKFLQVEVDPAGGSSYLNMGTEQLNAVPYSFVAQSANNLNEPLPLKLLSKEGALDGKVLKWSANTNQWEPADDLTGNPGSVYSAGNGIAISPSNQIINTGDLNPLDDITNTTSAGGDLTGSYPNPTLDKIQGKKVNASSPLVEEVLKWDGSQWQPDVDGLKLPATFNVNSNRMQSINRYALEISQGGPEGVFSAVNTNGNFSKSVLYAESNSNAIAAEFINKGAGRALALSNSNLNSNAQIFSITSNGLGEAMHITGTNANNTSSMIGLVNTGKGNGIDLQIPQANSTGSGININSIGLGKGININIDNTSSSQPALDIRSTGSGGLARLINTNTSAFNSDAVYIEANAAIWGLHIVNKHSSGIGAKIENTNASSVNDALQVVTAGTGHALRCTGTALKTAGGNTWAVPSDVRLKKDIKPFNDGLNVIEKISPKKFRYNGLAGTNDKNEEIGIIAQEMETIAPYTINHETVKLDLEKDQSNAEILTYNGSALQYVMINAIKELSQDIRMLKKENEELKVEINQLKKVILKK